MSCPPMSHVEFESGARAKAAVDIQTRRMAWSGRGRGKGRRGQHGLVHDEVWASGPRVYQPGPWSPIPDRGAQGVGQVCREFIWEYGAEVAARALRGWGLAGCADLGSRAGNKEHK